MNDQTIAIGYIIFMDVVMAVVMTYVGYVMFVRPKQHKNQWFIAPYIFGVVASFIGMAALTAMVFTS